MGLKFGIERRRLKKLEKPKVELPPLTHFTEKGFKTAAMLARELTGKLPVPLSTLESQIRRLGLRIVESESSEYKMKHLFMAKSSRGGPPMFVYSKELSLCIINARLEGQTGWHTYVSNKNR